MSTIWAKSPVSPGVDPITLYQHTLDVTKQMSDYFRLYQPQWPVPEEPVCLPRVLAYAALVHDFGKIHPAFQAALRPGGPRFENRHEVLSLAFLSHLDIPANERPWIEAAVALHHKDLAWLVGPSQWFYPGECFGRDGTAVKRLTDGVKEKDAELLCRFLRHSREFFHKAGWPDFKCYDILPGWPVDLLEYLRSSLERVVNLAQRFRAATDDFGRFIAPLPWPLRRAGVMLRGFILNSDHLASFQPHPLKIGLQSVESVGQSLASAVKDFKGFKSHQESAAGRTGNAVLIAPTGTGKTEAALLWAARQAEDGLKGRTYFLLPYQTSMNAMQQRLVKTFAPAAWDDPKQWEAEVAMVHGRSMRAAYEKLLDRKYLPTDADREAHLQSDLARLNVAPIRVCSPFQLARLLFAPKGLEGLLLAFSQARLVFDEIHAYDPQVTAMALTAVRFLTNQFGSRVLFMTATLPSHLQEILVSLFDPISILRPSRDVLEEPPRHRLRLMPNGVDVLSASSIAIIKEAAEAGSVLVVVNQVRRARELYRSIKESGKDAYLLHSRFTYQDRARKEKRIEPCPGMILIATQAVEVSLDLDYDMCFSELAPLESLLQRFGRCNRRGRQSNPATVNLYRSFPGNGNGLYRPYSEDHLRQTLSTLERFAADNRDGLMEESRTQALLDSSYPEALKKELADQIRSKVNDIDRLFVQPFAPFGAEQESIGQTLDQQWQELFDGEEVLPVGRRTCAAQEVSWLGRSRYYVPISGRKFAQLWRKGKVHWDDDLMCNLIEADYTEEEGLDV